MAFKGINIRQSSGAGADRLVFRFSLKDSSGNDVTTGTTTLKLYELQSDGTLKSYDFNDNTFKMTALTTETLALTHRTGNNGATNTGLWTAALTTLTGFTVGNIYVLKVNNSSASPANQERQFQYGAVDGDTAISATGKVPATLAAGDVSSNLPVDLQTIKTQAVTAAAGVTFPASIGTSTYAGGAVASVTAPVTVNAVNGLAPPANWNLMAIDANGRIDLSKWLGNAVTVDAGNYPNVNARDWGGTQVTGGLPNAGNVTVGGYAAGQDPAVLVWGATTRTLTAFGFSVAVGAGGITAASFAADAIDANAIATDALGSLELAAGAASEIADAVWASTARTLTAFGFTVRATDSAGNALGTATGQTAILTDTGALVSRLTTGRAGNLDNLNAPISGIAATILVTPANKLVTNADGSVTVPGLVLADVGTALGGGTATQFTATGAGLSTQPGAYNGQFLKFNGGVNKGEWRQIQAYTLPGGIPTLAFGTPGFTSAPGNGDSFVIG